jgi:sulfate adenylyltransferase large subunit
MSLNIGDAERVDLLRFITAGSVDDGKSTLIGRLLFDSKTLFHDQVTAIKAHGSGEINFANLTDGLRAEREQGITIDVAYRYFSTAKRRFIVADSPGHVQYTRNMFTAASNTDLAVILVDATKGITEQTCRHTYLSSLLAIPHIVVCINKMDLLDYCETAFESIRGQFLEFADTLQFKTIEFIPVSALHGDNLVLPSPKTPWHSGAPLLRYLEEIDVAVNRLSAARFPVQWIINSGKREHDRDHFRGYAGQIYGGTFTVGDAVTVLPSGKHSRIADIYTLDGSLQCASAPQSVTIRLEDELDIGRGDMLTHEGFEPHVRSNVTAVVCWMDDEPWRQGRTYAIKQSARSTRVKAKELHATLDINTLVSSSAPDQSLNLNEIGIVSFSATSPLVYDAYSENYLTGSFIIVDELSNATAGAGLCLNPINLASVLPTVALKA